MVSIFELCQWPPSLAFCFENSVSGCQTQTTIPLRFQHFQPPFSTDPAAPTLHHILKNISSVTSLLQHFQRSLQDGWNCFNTSHSLPFPSLYIWTLIASSPAPVRHKSFLPPSATKMVSIFCGANCCSALDTNSTNLCPWLKIYMLYSTLFHRAWTPPHGHTHKHIYQCALLFNCLKCSPLIYIQNVRLDWIYVWAAKW